MRRLVSILLLFALLITSSSPVLAGMEEKLAKHWARGEIDRDFFLYYFPYLAKEDYNRFSPNEFIGEDEFLLSFTSLLNNKGYANKELGWDVDLTREQMARIVGGKLLANNLIEKTGEETNFADIENCSRDIKNSIIALGEAGIIKGEGGGIFNPKRKASQAEAIVVLQRVEKLIDEHANIPFKLSGIVQTYSGAEGINVKEDKDKIIVSITKSLPNPGYNVKIDKITKSKEGYKVHLDIIPPPKDSVQLQVVVYKTITIEINKEEVGNPPYNFILEGNFLSKNLI